MTLEIRHIRFELKAFYPPFIDKIDDEKYSQYKKYALVETKFVKPVIVNFPNTKKLVLPDRKSKVEVGHFHRIVRVVHDTKPHEPNKGVLFVLIEHAPDCAVCWEKRLIEYYEPYVKIVDKFCGAGFTPEMVARKVRQLGYHFCPPGPDGKPANNGKCLTPEIFMSIAKGEEHLFRAAREEIKRKEEERKYDAYMEKVNRHRQVIGNRTFVIENPYCVACQGTCEYVRKIIIDAEKFIRIVVDWEYEMEGEHEETLKGNYIRGHDYILYEYEGTRIKYGKNGVIDYTWNCENYDPKVGAFL